jgi:CHAD domain-containing protein
MYGTKSFQNMNNLNVLYDRWKIEQKEFEKQKIHLKQRISSGPIHDIRVSIKKLRSFLKLYILLKQQLEWEYLFLKTNKLFEVLGKYREIEICLDLIDNYEKKMNCNFRQFKNHLHLLIKNSKTWANDEIHRYNAKELAKIALLLKQDAELNNDKTLADKILQLFEEKIIESSSYFKQPHKLRQHLKDIYYWEIFFSEEIKSKCYFKNLHKILDDLGNWQDRELFSIRMKHFRKDYLPKQFEEYEILKKFEKTLAEEKKLQLKTGISDTRKWLLKIKRKRP